MMTPSELKFMSDCGIKPEEIVPASTATGGYRAVFESCPNCSARRHRNTKTGAVICLSCEARKRREHLRLLDDLRRFSPVLPVTYRGYEVAKLEGQGWRYREPGGLWFSAVDLRTAKEKIERLTGPEQPADPDWEMQERKCRMCDAPSGSRDYCRSCGIDKFGDAQ